MLLQKLLDSIPNINEIEVIIIVEEYNTIKAMYSKNNVFFYDNHKKNKGAGTCRNIGLQKAQGKWVLFADADDYFFEGFYEEIAIFFKEDFDVVFFPPSSINLKDMSVSDRHIKFTTILENYRENKEETFVRYDIPGPISKLIKRDFIITNNIKFDEVIASNDEMFSVRVGYYMKTFFISTKTIYCITKSKGTLTQNISLSVTTESNELII